MQFEGLCALYFFWSVDTLAWKERPLLKHLKSIRCLVFDSVAFLRSCFKKENSKPFYGSKGKQSGDCS